MATPPPSPAASTADAQDVARFTAMAEQWWDPLGKFKPLHALNEPRIRFLRDHVAAHFGRDVTAEKPFAGLTLLDIGCGGGLLSEPMARLGFSVTGVDAGDKNIKIASLHAEQSGLAIDYRVGTPEQLEEGQYDVVLAMEVVEHVADVPAFLAACAARVKPGGLFFAATLNRTAKSFALAIVGAEYVLGWLPRGTHDWKKFLKPAELSGHLRRNGLEVRDLQGVHFNPLRDLWTLGPGLDVNYLVMATRA